MNKITPYNNSRDMMLLDQKEHITREEHEKILQACVEVYNTKKASAYNQYIMERNYFFLLCLWNTGARVSDVCQFRVGNIDTYKGCITFDVSKTSKKHIVMLEETFILAFHNYVQKWNIKGYLFTKFKDINADVTTQEHIKRRHGNMFIAEYGEQAGITRNVHPHLYRHGIAVDMLNNGVAIEFISKFLGHSNVQTTANFYAKITPEICMKFIHDKMRIN